MDTVLKQNTVEFNHQEKINDNTLNQNDSGCETSTTKSIEETLTTSTNTIENIDTLVIRKDPQTNRKLINKSAYAKLHRSLSPTRSSQLDLLKSKYEKSDNDTDITKSDTENPETKLELIRQKSKLPLPVPRSKIKSEIIIPSPSQKISDKKHRHSLMLDKKTTKKKDENSNEVFRKSSSSSGEFITIVRRSESIETVDKFEKELDLFTMDKKPKDKKRASSFRKIFSGKIFHKEKKKKEESEKRNAQSDNLQNENNFSRQSPHRNSLGSNVPKPLSQDRRIPPPNIDMQEIERRYAKMHVKEFNNIKQNFENHNSADEPDDIPTLTPGPMSFSKISNINKFIDSSSLASDSEKDSSSRTFTDQESPYKSIRFADTRRDTPPRAQELRQTQDVRLVNPKALIPINSERPLPNPYQNATTKPVISPKPQILSPKPKMQQFDFNEKKPANNFDNKIFQPILDETYGTVFDNVDRNRNSSSKVPQKPPRSPSLEATKLRMPPNRDIGPMSPRMRSPIPQHHVSTEKLIATELLRTSRSPTPTKKKINQLSSSHQRLESIDYPESNHTNEYVRNPIVKSKPPISRIIVDQRGSQLSPNYENQPPISRIPNQRNGQLSPTYDSRINQYPGIQNASLQRNSYESQNNQSSPNLRMPETVRNSPLPPSYDNTLQRNSQLSSNYDNRIYQSSLVGSQERLMGNSLLRSPTPTNLQNAELTMIKPQGSGSSTPVDLRIPPTSQTPSPQKEEMRRNVEAYYWKEIKKLKEQENRDFQYYQMQLMPFGYAEDPINYRRSRSSSPSSQRNGRRSLSLPRESKSQLTNVEVSDNHQRFQPAPIPEGRAVVNYPNAIYYQQNFRRNTPERRTIDTVPRSNGNAIYRPIFKRGSLTTPVREFAEDQQQKKVSFNGGKQRDAWPTRNGYTQSPPQRRLDSIRPESLDDDVFLPNQQTTKLIVDGKEIYGYTNRPYDNHAQRQQDPHYQNANFYKQIQQEPIYSSQSKQVEGSRIPVGMTRYNSIQLAEPIYGQNQRLSRRMSFDNSQRYVPKQVNYSMPRRQIYIKDDVYGYFGGYVPNEQQQMQQQMQQQLQQQQGVVYSSKQNIADPTYSWQVKQGSVRDKVCDMYGQIHDRDSPSLNIRKSGVMLGQLQQNSQSQLPPNQNFVRNSRLTASANDMYRRYQNVEPRYPSHVVYERHQVQNDRPPSRPLPPVPTDKNVYYRQNTDSRQGFSDVQKTSSLGKNQKRGIFGK